MPPAEFIASIAWPLTILVIALLFRAPLTEALRTGSGRLSAGPFRIEWEERAAEIEADLGLSPSISKGEIGGAAERLDEIADASPVAAVVDTFGQIEIALRSLLEEHELDNLDRRWTVRQLSDAALQHNLISTETKDAIEGLSVMRNLAVHGHQKELSSQRVREFVALGQGVLYAISMNAKAAKSHASAAN